MREVLKPYEIKNLNYNTIEISFKFKSKIDFLAGQFFNLEIEDNKKNEKIKRSYSVCSKEKTNIISFCIKKKGSGKFSNIFFNCDLKNKNFLIEGPFGKANSQKFMYDNLILIAIGSGISPILSIIKSFNLKKKIYLVYGNRYEEDILYKSYLDRLEEENKNFNVRYVLSKPKEKHKHIGYVQNFLDDLDFENCDIFICGKTKMVIESSNIIKNKFLWKKFNLIKEFFG